MHIIRSIHVLMILLLLILFLITLCDKSIFNYISICAGSGSMIWFSVLWSDLKCIGPIWVFWFVHFCGGVPFHFLWFKARCAFRLVAGCFLLEVAPSLSKYRWSTLWFRVARQCSTFLSSGLTISRSAIGSMGFIFVGELSVVWVLGQLFLFLLAVGSLVSWVLWLRYVELPFSEFPFSE